MEQNQVATGVEDKVLKVAMHAFGESVMKYLGQKDRVERIGPTEHIHLEMKQMYEDFNFEMKEGYWRHYEFESDRISVKDMRRFREYEAYLSMVYNMPVITTVLCSAKVKKLRNKLVEGINTYRIEAIQLKKKDADKEIRKLRRKLKSGEQIGQEDLVPLLLTPLMAGQSTVCERIRKGFRILKELQDSIEEEEIKKMQAILYTFANKFLNDEELGKIKEEIGMTTLGRMLWEDGVADGIERGIQAFVNLCKKYKESQNDTIVKVGKEFKCSKEKAEGYVKKYWEDGKESE